MAVGVFDCSGQLGKGFAQLGQEHHRVKTKAVAAASFAGDVADDAAHGNQRLGVLWAAHGHQRADQRGAAVVLVLHLLQQSAHVVVIAFVVAKLRAVVRRVHARQAAKGVDAQAGVVGNGGQAGVGGGKARFGQGVFNKGAVRLLGLAHAQVGLANQLHAQRGEHGLQFGQFAEVVGCQYDFHSQKCL